MLGRWDTETLLNEIMNSATSMIVIDMPLQNPQLFIYPATPSDPGIYPFWERRILFALKRTHDW